MKVTHCSVVEFDLDAFMKNFEKSQSELKWIRDASRKNEDNESELTDSKDRGFDEEDESSVDHWYNKFRKSECSTNNGSGGQLREFGKHSTYYVVHRNLIFFIQKMTNFFFSRIENIERLLWSV